jgi:hypothetical protein
MQQPLNNQPYCMYRKIVVGVLIRRIENEISLDFEEEKELEMQLGCCE